MTKPDEMKKHELSPKQELVAELLAAGETISRAAEKAGVARQTVSEWANHNGQFRVAMECRRAEVWQTMITKLRVLVPKAIDVLEAELMGENAFRAAVQIVKLAGLNNASAPLSQQEVAALESGRNSRTSIDLRDLSDIFNKRDT